MFAGRSVLPSPFAVILSLVVGITALLLPIRVDDLWWHLRAGDEILSRGALLTTNTFSFTAPDSPWLMHEWLTEVLFALVWRVGGMPMLVLLGVTAFNLTVVLAWRQLTRERDTGWPAALLAGYLAVLLLTAFSLRPWIITHAFLAGLLLLVPSKLSLRQKALATFALFVPWANLHGSFFAGLLALGAFTGGAVLGAITRRGDLLTVREAFTLLSSGMLGSLATPTPLERFLHPLQYATGSLGGGVLKEILHMTIEWRSPGVTTPLGMMLCGLVLLCVATVVLSRRVPHPSHLALVAGFGFMAFSSIRSIPLAALAAAPLLGRHLPLAWERRRTPHAPLATSHLPLPALVSAACTMCVLSAPGTLGNPAKLSPEFFPEGLMAAVRKHAPARTFNHYDFGGAIQWHLWPQTRVFWDQRTDCYPPELLRDALDLHGAKPGWEALLTRWKIDAVAYRKDTALAEALGTAPGWRVAWEDGASVLYLPATPGR